jgi:hypothetical protein
MVLPNTKDRQIFRRISSEVNIGYQRVLVGGFPQPTVSVDAGRRDGHSGFDHRERKTPVSLPIGLTERMVPLRFYLQRRYISVAANERLVISVTGLG